jgi:hypothetical protein
MVVIKNDFERVGCYWLSRHHMQQENVDTQLNIEEQSYI